MDAIYQVKEFKELKPILNVFCRENQLSNESTIERIQAHESQFNRDDFIYFLISQDGVAKGFMSCEVAEENIITRNLFIEKCEDYDKLIYQLIVNVSKQLESLKKRYLQIFFVNNLELEEKFIENDFMVYQRVKMVYDLKENHIPENKLPINYQPSYFTLDRLDEELQVVVDTFKGAIDAEIFRQFSCLDDLRDFFFRSKMDTDRLRKDSPIILKNGKIVGVNIVMNLSEKASYIWIIALLPEHHGKGLGKYLMLKSHEDCKKANLDQIVLDVTVENKTAFNLYKNLGYKETNRYLTLIKKYH